MKTQVKVGQEYGRWVVVGSAPARTYRYGNRIQTRPRVLCRCSCKEHTEVPVVVYDLIYRKSTSCGCLAAEQLTKTSTTHGLSNTGIYESWQHMWSRCARRTAKEWKWYGGRGISVTPRWKRFEAFYADMRKGWKPGLTLDRINGNAGYHRSNCRWVTRARQQRNRRSNRRVLLNGRPMILTEAAETVGVSVHALKWRLNANNGITRIRRTMICDIAKASAGGA